MVTLRVYVDEADSHGSRNELPLIVAGCVATPVDWTRYDQGWYTLLKKHHLDHMNFDDLINRRGKFSGITRAKEDQIFQDFGTAANLHTWFGFNTVVYDADFKKFKGPTKGLGPKLSTALDSDYGVSIRIIYSFIHSYIPAIPGVESPSIYVVAESGHRNEGVIATMLEKYRKAFPNEEDQIIKDARLADKNFCYGVQGADFHAGVIKRAEREKKVEYINIPGDVPGEGIGDWRIHTNDRIRWFRLPINEEVLTQIKKEVILSKPQFTRLYGDQLTSQASDDFARSA